MVSNRVPPDMTQVALYSASFLLNIPRTPPSVRRSLLPFVALRPLLFYLVCPTLNMLTYDGLRSPPASSVLGTSPLSRRLVAAYEYRDRFDPEGNPQPLKEIWVNNFLRSTVAQAGPRPPSYTHSALPSTVEDQLNSLKLTSIIGPTSVTRQHLLFPWKMMLLLTMIPSRIKCPLPPWRLPSLHSFSPSTILPAS